MGHRARNHISESKVECDFGNMGEILNTTQRKSMTINCVLDIIVLHYTMSSLGNDLHS